MTYWPPAAVEPARTDAERAVDAWLATLNLPEPVVIKS